MSQQKPTVGRTVHYYAEPNDKEGPPRGPFAAMVAGVDTESGDLQIVDLVVFFPGATGHAKTRTPYSASPKPQTWTWPPKV